MKRAQGRVIYFDILNILSCIAVITLHHNSLVDKYSPQIATAWNQSLIVEVLAYFAVPVFLMLSGATLMDYRKRYDTKTFFQKRLSRVLVPYVVWSVITFLYALTQGKYTMVQLSAAEIWNIFMKSDMMIIYWFFPVIISIYLAMPILSLLTQRRDQRKWLWYMVSVGLITYSILPPVCKLVGLQFNSDFQFPLVGGGFIIYPVLGYLLATQKIKIKFIVMICLGGIAALAFRYGVTYFLTLHDGATNYTLFNYTYFTSVLPAAALFILAKHTPWESYIQGKWVNVLATISSCSLGIYLIHLLVLYVELGQLRMNETQLRWRIVMPVATYATCLAIVWIVKSGVLSRRLFP